MKIAIASGKGGTGKTTISTNLASYLEERGKVVLADLDVEEPNSALFLKCELNNKEDKFKKIPEWESSKCTLCGLCEEVCNYNAIIKLGDEIKVFPELCSSCYACSGLCPEDALPMKDLKMGELKNFDVTGFTFVESRLDIGQEHATPLIAATNDYIEENYKDDDTIILFDSPPGTSCPVIEATKDVDIVLLVTEPTPFGLHDLTLAVDTMRELKKDFGVIINRYGIGNDDVLKYCKKEKIPIIAKIPNDRKIAELYSQGKLIYKKVPEFYKQMRSIEYYILNYFGRG